MCAFVDRVESIVAEQLLDGMVAGVAGSAEDLNRVVIGLQPPHAWPGLHDRGEHVEKKRRACTLGLVLCSFGFVEERGGVEDETESAFDVALRGQEHAADIGVFDDQDLRGILAAAVVGAALAAFTGIAQCVEVTVVAERDGPSTDADARRVHHVEHVGQALAALPHEVADSTG